MAYKIIDIEGIGPQYAEKLKSVDVHTTDDLLKMWADETHRQTLIEKTGLSANLFDKWVRMSELMRVKGIGPQYAELLLSSGVDTVMKLRQQPADVLLKKLTEQNAARKLTGALPSATEIQKWVDDGKTLEPVVVR